MSVSFTENTTIDYDVQGKEPPLILLGDLGYGGWAGFKQVPAFSRHFRTITLDVRGEWGLENGVTELAADTVVLLDHLGVGKAHVLGTSLGGFVAQELALARPVLSTSSSSCARTTAGGAPSRCSRGPGGHDGVGFL
jgi:3-oxoadipate enol-lactonase